jgi:hypothetical protein
VPLWPSETGTGRGFRDRPWGKAAILVAILALALVASRTCGAAGARISQDEAVAIAKRQIDYEPDRVNVRFFRRGVPSRGAWAVSLSTVEESSAMERLTTVVVDAGTGRVVEINRSSP